jgi:ribokinase
MIGVDAEGNNSIIVYSGANGALVQEDIIAAKKIVESAKVILMQLEIPTSCLEAATEIANGITILNPAPVVDIPKGLLEKVDVLVPNQIELAHLSNMKGFNNLDEIENAAKSLDIETVIVTLGSKGALLVSGSDTELISSPVVDSVDTTGAGDAFCGSLAESLSRGMSFLESVEQSVVVGALSTTKHGAQISMPSRSEVDSFLR